MREVLVMREKAMRVVKAPIAAAAVAAIGVVTAWPADAVTAYMDGVLNVGPGWHTITMPDGSRCGVDCREVKYDYITPASAKKAALEWMIANNDEDAVLNAYSLGALGAADARALLPDWKGTLNLLGTSVKPDNGASYADGGRDPLDVGGGEVNIISTAGDSVAYRKGSLSAHVNDYRGRDFSTEEPVKVSEPTDAVNDLEYGEAPKLSWRERAELRRVERETRAEQRKIDRAERREASQARWRSFWDRVTGKETTDVGRAAPVEDETQPSGPLAATERPTSADSESGNE